MNVLKKSIHIFLIFILVLCICGCTKEKSTEKEKSKSELIVEQIEKIGTITLNSETTIADIEKNYEKLTEEEKKEVTNYNTLVEKRTYFNNIKNVYDLINSIGIVTENSEQIIVSAETAYNALSNEQKLQITNYANLVNARTTYNSLPKTITLTTSNVKDYFNIDCSLSTYSTDIFDEHTTYATFTTKASLKQTVKEINNVTITVKVNYKETRQEYGEFKDSETVKLSINALNGSAVQTFDTHSTVVDLTGSSTVHRPPKYYLNSCTVSAVTGSIKK